MDRLTAALLRLSATPVLIVSTILFAVFLIRVLPVQAQQAEQYSADIGSPDTLFYYTPQTLYDIAAAYEDSGRRLYVQARYRFDIVWPLVYALFLISAISHLSQMLFPPAALWHRLTLVPFCGLLMDFAENLLVTLVMVRFPATTPIADVASGITTTLKWILVNGSFLILLGLMLLWLIRLLQRRKPG